MRWRSPPAAWSHSPACSPEGEIVNTRRLIFALLGALVISGSCTFLLARRLSRGAAKPVPTIQYVTASTPIVAGEIVKPEQLTLVAWPATQPFDGPFKKISDVAGRAAVYPIDKGQVVLDKYLAAAGSGIGLTTKIPDGMRAIALKSNEVVGVAGFLFPGSHVDVLVTYHPPTGDDFVTATVLQNAPVLAVGHQIQADPSGKPTTVDVLTILANPQDAEKVVLASTQGTIHFVLRNSNDQANVPNAPVQLTQLGPPAKTPPPPERRSTAVIKRDKPYVVETIEGNKQSSVSFDLGQESK